MVSPVNYEHFYRHQELEQQLATWHKEAPDLLDVEVIGHSWEGRSIPFCTLTNRRTGPAEEKPGFLVEANIHAAEITASFAALDLIHHLLSSYGKEERASRLLDTRALYVVPRLNPDGVEAVLDEHRYLRSSVRPHPSLRREPGLHYRDVDGDGRMLFMRFPDPQGPWKASQKDPRLLVRRDPDEEGGSYYRLLVEGEIENYDGSTIPVAEAYEGLDLGQNYQTGWADMASHPRSAGPFSGSEPEIQAMMRAATDRPNITGYITCHTFGGLHLHPPVNDDGSVPYADLKLYREMGQRAAGFTGYRPMSYHDLKYAPMEVRGAQISWFYEELGVYSWITEFWDPVRAAGVTSRLPSGWLGDHPEEDDLALLAWNDTELGGRGFVDWYPFDHPQLGPVELGGWDIINYWYNPPLERAAEEVARHTPWVVQQVLSSPLLDLREVRVTQQGSDLYRVRATVANTGWLPTYVTHKALERGLCGQVEVTLDPGKGRVLGPAATQRLGQLEGRTQARTTTTWWGHDPGTPDMAAAEWLVSAPAGEALEVIAAHPRAGTVRMTVRADR